ncbi:MAG TPA: TIM-barrel domain-containing protein, partial [Polyangiaceae bacterium]|nr:TIM-barrel domain-containing protein [Polyangiaceae bacterium]
MRQPLRSARTSALLSSLLLITAAVAAPACAGDEVLAPVGRTEVISAGDASIGVDTTAREITLRRGETTLLRFPSEAFEIGTVAALSDAVNYDPYRLYVANPLYSPPPITWRRATSFSVLEASGARVSLRLTFEGGQTASLSIKAESEGRLRAHLKPDEGGSPIAYFRLRPRASADEGFYGLGEYFDEVNHRGKVRAMQLEFDPELESTYNEAHVPVPFVIGTRGWGLFVESSYPGVFALATEESDRIDAAFGTGLASPDGLVFHLFAAARPLDVTRHYYDVTGYPRLPARWGLGPWIWRDESKDQTEVESDLNTIRDLDLATTGYWIDRPYATGVNTFDFDANKFGDAQGMIDLAHGLGFRMALWHTPYLDEADPSTQALRDHATASGFYPKEAGLKLNKWGVPLDLTNPDAYAWWQGLIRSYTAMGIEGFKLDYGEDIVPGLTVDRNRWVFADGSDERTMHRGFQLVYHRVYSETLPEEGGFLLCRSGKYGDQVNVSVIWPGDLDANFARYGDVIEGEAKAHVGGLPASVVAGLSLGPSGFPFYGADTGGYRHAPPDKETFTRWFEQTALSTVMQIGTSSNNVAWEFGPETGFDQEMLDWYRTYTRLHLRLFPYVWTYAKAIELDGRPIQRALGLV